MMYPGARCPLLSTLVCADGSGEVPGLGAEVGSSVYILLVFMGSRVGSEVGGLLGESPWMFSLFSESSRCIRGFITLSSSLESLSFVSMTTVMGSWRVYISF